jgi:hypothetical protein
MVKIGIGESRILHMDTPGSLVCQRTITPVCNVTRHWQGVRCMAGSSQCRINQLILPNYGLNGTLPFTLGNLASLMYLELEENELSGIYIIYKPYLFIY